MPITFDIHKVTFSQVTADGYKPQNFLCKPPKPEKPPKAEKPVKVVAEKAKKTAARKTKSDAPGPILGNNDVKLGIKAGPQNHYLAEKPVVKKPKVTITDGFQLPPRVKPVQQPVSQNLVIDHVESPMFSVQPEGDNIPFIELPPIRVRQPVPQPAVQPAQQPQVPVTAPKPALPAQPVVQKKVDKLDLKRLYEEEMRLLSAQFKF